MVCFRDFPCSKKYRVRTRFASKGRDWNDLRICMVSGFCRKADEHCTLLGYYAASIGNFLQAMKREDQQDATIRCLLLTSVSICFGHHHYAHLQENKGPVTAFGVLLWFCWMWLVAVVGRCLATATNHIQQNQNNTPNAVTGPLFS